MRWYNPFAYVTQLRSDSDGYNPGWYHSPYTATLASSWFEKVKMAWVVIMGTRFENAEKNLEKGGKDKPKWSHWVFALVEDAVKTQEESNDTGKASEDKNGFLHYQDIYYGLSDYLFLLIPEKLIEGVFEYGNWLEKQKIDNPFIMAGHYLLFILLYAVAGSFKGLQMAFQTFFIVPLFLLSLPIVTLVHWGSLIAASVLEKRAEELLVFDCDFQYDFDNKIDNKLVENSECLDLLVPLSAYIAKVIPDRRNPEKPTDSFKGQESNPKTFHEYASEYYQNRSHKGLFLSKLQFTTKKVPDLRVHHRNQSGDQFANIANWESIQSKKAVAALVHLGFLKTDKITAAKFVFSTASKDDPTLRTTSVLR